MNVYDSERIAAVLAPLGYQICDSVNTADLIVMNTCAIREKAEQKVFSFLGRLADIKRRRPQTIIAVGGCVAQQEGKRILKRVRFVDLVFGTQAVGRLPSLIQRVETQRVQLIDTDLDDNPFAGDSDPQPEPGLEVTRFVTIMQGCDNFCSYCVVPYVRGRELSRPPEAVVAEVDRLVTAGVREVTLLGQNVNSYGRQQGICSFAQLLARVARIAKLERIRFTTSHPKDLSSDLIQAFADNPKLCHHIHLPVQSGADAILKRMNRGYTRETYLDRIESLRQVCPAIAITSDIIVGFPGESDRHFAETLQLIEQVGFDGLFAFKYSDRPNASAARFKQKVPEAVKKERLAQVLRLQEKQTLKKHKALLGSRQQVLVEGPNPKKAADPLTAHDPADPARDSVQQWTGRTKTNKIVNFTIPGDIRQAVEGPNALSLKGRLIEVRIERALAHSLWGCVLDLDDTLVQQSASAKGETSYAA
jgi:tRNA-2-methylthio-N6-dimethylallyladenosine synthase